MLNLPQEKPNVSILHIALSSVFVVMLWIYSLTILSPLLICLKISKNCQKLFFSWMLSKIGPLFINEFSPLRKKLFELLPTNVENIKILEIGVGGGSNFSYYPENCKLTLLDMNEHFEAEIRKKLLSFPKIKVEKIIIATAENMIGIADSEFDVVLCTRLLCSVQDSTSVLKEVHRVLKQEGKFVYMEHVGFPKTHPGYWIQSILNPLWKIYFCGCHLNRRSHDIINNYFSKNSYKISYPSLPLFCRPHVIGIATKCL